MNVELRGLVLAVPNSDSEKALSFETRGRP